MRLLKFVGIVFAVFLVVLLILPALMKDTAETSQSIVIKADAQTIFRQVNSFQNWQKWSPFELGDTNMVSVYEGPLQGVGNKHVWKSKSMGDGSMLILKSEPYTFIQSLLDMNGNGKAFDEWTFVEKVDGVEVTWALKLSGLKYPFYKYFGYFIESMMKPMQEKGLAKLKEISENEVPSLPVERIELESIPSLTIYDSAMMNMIGSVTEQNFSELALTMSRSRIAAAGPAFGLYYNWTEDAPIRMRVGFPVAEEARESGRVTFFKLPGGTTLKTTLVGPYMDLYKAHLDLDAYMADYQLSMKNLGVWEEYVVGPATEKDSTKWITNIYYPYTQKPQ